jgi:uncharacterized delta-60 repeat protein
LSDGTLDPGFGAGGKVITDFFGGVSEGAAGVVVQDDGRIIAGGTAFNRDHFVVALCRYEDDGSLDTTYGDGGKVAVELFGDEQAYAIALQPDGKVVAIGNVFSNGLQGTFVARYLVNGTLDATFGSGGKVLEGLDGKVRVPTSLALGPGGKIVMTGWTLGNHGVDFAIARYNSDGSADSSFGQDGQVSTDFFGFDDIIYGVAVQADGGIIATGYSSIAPQVAYMTTARYRSDGTLDPAFGTGGFAVDRPSTPNSNVGRAVAIQRNGKIVIAGGGELGFEIVRLDSTGNLDARFGDGGDATATVGQFGSEAHCLAIQDDGKIVVAGFSLEGFALVRYKGDRH